MVHHGPDSPDDLPGHYPVQGKEPRGADSLVSDVCLSPSTSLSAVSVPLQATPVVHFAHGFHVWNITVRPPALSTYLFVDCSVSDHPVLKQAQKVLRDEFKSTTPRTKSTVWKRTVAPMTCHITPCLMVA